MLIVIGTDESVPIINILTIYTIYKRKKTILQTKASADFYWLKANLSIFYNDPTLC